MNQKSFSLIAVIVALVFSSYAGVEVTTEQIKPADPAWRFKNIPRPSKIDIATGAKIRFLENPFEPVAGEPAVLLNGILPSDSLDLSEEALFSNGNPADGKILVDLGGPRAIAAVATYSWHEWDVDGGSRAPQIYTLYASAAADADPARLEGWIRIATVDTRPNKAGDGWNGQHGVFIRDSNADLGTFRWLLFAVQPTRSPRQPSIALTHTLFSEIDVHSIESLRRAGDAEIAKPADVEHVWVVFKTHLDIGYTDTIEGVLKKYRETMMDGALKVVEASRNLPPEQRFSWTLAGWPLTHVLGPLQETARRSRIEQAVREGAITFHALPFTTHTETQDLEDLVRGLGYASRLARQYDRPLPISAKMTDVPSHSWVMPTLLAHAGIKFLQLGCNGTSAYMRVPRLFWWEGPDGSRLLCNYTPDYGSGLRPPRTWPSKHYLAMEMTGDNHGPPTPAEVERLRQQAQKNLPGVQIHFGTLDDFVKAVIAENPDLPVIRADMPDTWIHGWLSMPIEAKAARQLRPLEPAVDMLDTQLRAWGVPTGGLAPILAEAYEQSGLFSEHTFGPWGPNGGSWNSGTLRYLYGEAWKAAYQKGAYKKYEQAFDDKRAFARRAEAIIHWELSERLDLLAKSVKAEGERLVVFNALPWKRSGLVEIPGQSGRFLFASDVPAGGYRTFRIHQAAGSKPVLQDPPTALDTPFFKVRFDLKRGGIASLIDKKTGRELVDMASPYVVGQFLHERFDKQQMVAFHNAYGRPGYSWPKGDLPEGAIYQALTPSSWTIAHQHHEAADTVTLRAVDTLGLAKSMAVVVILPRHQPYIEVEWRVTDKTPDPMPEGGWLCFPFAVSKPQFRLGRLGGPIDPAIDIVHGANRHYFCLNNGLTITGRKGTGIGLCPLDSSCVSLDEPGLWKFSLDYTPQKPSVFVNLYNNEWNTNFPEWQDGSWSSRVRFWPTQGRALDEDLVVPSWNARLPLLAVVANESAGPLPKEKAGVSLDRTGVLVTAFGQNPDGPGTLLRLWEQSGHAGACKIRLPAGFKAMAAQPVNLRGEPIGQVMPIRGGDFTVSLRAFAPISLVLKP